MSLPFILSIPHCSGSTPESWRSRIALDDVQILQAVDFGTREIFSELPAAGLVISQWSRLLVDLNRNPENIGEKGVVALSDYLGRPVFKNGLEPTADQIAFLVDRYYRPYHAQIAQAIASETVVGLVDCHSLNGTGPADAPDAGQKRKDVVLSNYGDHHGRQVADQPLTCPVHILVAAAEALKEQGFTISINAPYRGGYIIQHYGRRLQRSGRWAMQVELTQDLFMAPGDLSPDATALNQVKNGIEAALTKLAKKIVLSEKS